MTSNRQITFTYIPVVIIALLFVTPFVVSDKLYDGPIIAKEFWFLGVVALIILYTAIRLLIRKEKIKIRLDLPDILLLAFFIWGLINAIFITPYTPFFYNHKLEQHNRAEQRVVDRHAQRGLEGLLHSGLVALRLVGLAAKALDHAHALQPFLGHHRRIGQLILHAVAGFLDAAAKHKRHQ